MNDGECQQKLGDLKKRLERILELVRSQRITDRHGAQELMVKLKEDLRGYYKVASFIRRFKRSYINTSLSLRIQIPAEIGRANL